MAEAYTHYQIARPFYMAIEASTGTPAFTNRPPSRSEEWFVEMATRKYIENKRKELEEYDRYDQED